MMFKLLPLGPRKSGIPHDVDIPAPVIATIDLLSFINVANCWHLTFKTDLN